MHMHICIHVDIYIYIYVHIYVYIYIYVHICIYIYMQMHICIHVDLYPDFIPISSMFWVEALRPASCYEGKADEAADASRPEMGWMHAWDEY